MADHSTTLQRDDELPHQPPQLESFDSTKRFHVAFTSFKLLVIGHFNSQHTGELSHAFLQFYIVFELIYLRALIKVTGQESRNPIYRCLYIVFGTLGSELLLWTSLSSAMWLVINMCLLVFALACLVMRNSGRFLESVQLLDDAPCVEFQLDV